MLAKISKLIPDGLPDTLPTPAPPSFTATFNPSPDPPASNQFSLTDADGNNVANLILVNTFTEISITLAEGASFSSPPIVWSLPPDSGEPPTRVVDSTLIFSVPAPTHVLSPWVFRFIVNIDGITGIRSQNIYLAKPLSGTSFILKYGDNGNFSLVDSLDSSQDGAILGNELVMVNTQIDGGVIVNLVSDPPLDPAPVFASEPIVWSSGSQPGWVFPNPVPSDGLTLSFGIDQATAMGQSIGLQFAIVINGITVLSPDPIIINATIGDG
ncbi:MAG: hypothetical protein ACJ76Y_08555 [Thermoanaerobaculia bacterium]